MKERDFIICGHGSGNPSTKNMETYLNSRQSQKASNGKTKGLVCVVRFLKTEDQRKQFHDLYKTLLGRNIYSQTNRSYVYTPKNDGKYYSDCSSSGCFTYDKCGINNVKYFNTASMYYNGEKLDLEIKDGHIAEEDLSKLQVGDALLFRGNDTSRPLQIGHVEYVYELQTYGSWEQTGSRWKFKKEDGKYAKAEWMEINHHWYWFNEEEYAVTGYQVINGERFYFETGGALECALMKTNERGALVIWEI